jgi:hypothetical protein
MLKRLKQAQAGSDQKQLQHTAETSPQAAARSIAHSHDAVPLAVQPVATGHSSELGEIDHAPEPEV